MCLFCQKFLDKEGILYENDTVFVLKDGFPVSNGHVLVITKRHISDYFQTTEKEVLDIDQALKVMKERLSKEFKPDGYNIGINNGEASGQTIMHLHVHLIPRYTGDTLNPKGGVRGVIPSKQKY
jgi:diadenosine tetraphosphate (Ap4A) HIT family hydrolase